MGPRDQDGSSSATSDSSKASDHKKKLSRTPLKQFQLSRSSLPSPPRTPLRRRRRRLGGKRKVRSCTACRAAHVRCVADRYGVPCERCAKKLWQDCTLMRQQGQTPIKNNSTELIELDDDDSSQSRDLKQAAADALEIVVEESKQKPRVSKELRVQPGCKTQ